MSNLLDLLGQENLDTLTRVAGGTRLYVPKHYGKPPGGGRDSSKRLAGLFGESLAILLVFHFGDSVIHVPKCRNAPPMDRRKLARLVRRPDLSTRAIARKAGCNRRTVEKMRARVRAAHQRKENGR